MEKTTWKCWIRNTAFLCVFVICAQIILFVIKSEMNAVAYADSSNTSSQESQQEKEYEEILARETPRKMSTDYIKIDLSEYNLKDRYVYKEKLNDTGVKILYDTGEWMYLNEYMNQESDYNIGVLSDEKLIDAKHIVGFEVAPGYEAVIRDGTKMDNGEEHKTSILGPLRLLGRSENDYLESDDYKEKGSKGDKKGEYELYPDKFQSSDSNPYNINYKSASSEQFDALWSYNWSDILAKEHKEKSYSEDDVRNDVKIFDIKSIMVKRTTLREGVYLMRGMYNVLNGETKKDMKDNFSRGIFEYIVPSMNEEDAEVMYYANETKTNGSVNGIMVVGDYEVKMERKRSSAMIGKESETTKEFLTVRGSKNKAVVITDAWGLNYGYRGMKEDIVGAKAYPVYSTTLAEGLMGAVAAGLAGIAMGFGGGIAIAAMAEICLGITVFTGGVGGIVIGIVAVGVAAVGLVWGLFAGWFQASKAVGVKPYYNDLVNLTIMPRGEGAKEIDYNTCVYFEDETQQYAFTRKGTKDNKDQSLVEKEGIFKIRRYDNHVKVHDIAEINEEPAVTAYTERNFKGNYFRFLKGETSNIGDDKVIEGIKSLEIAPNTRVIFSDQEDCYHRSEPDYGSIHKKENTTNALVVEGPAYISDLEKYLDGCCIEDGKLSTYSNELKSFRVQGVKNDNLGFSLCKEKDGIGTFENINTALYMVKLTATFTVIAAMFTSTNESEIKDVEQQILDNLGIDSLAELGAINVNNIVGKKLQMSDYYPQSISVGDNYFVKLYDKNSNLVRTIIGPATNYNLRLDEENEQKMKEYSNACNEANLFKDNEEVEGNVSGAVEGYTLTSDNDDKFGVELARIINGASYKQLTTKSLEYLKEFCEEHKGNSTNSITDRNNTGVPDEKESIRIICRDFLNFYKKKSSSFNKSERLKKNESTILKNLYENEDYKNLRARYQNDKLNAKEKADKYEEEERATNNIKSMYTNFQEMSVVINKLTQRDKKSRSLENVDGVILYQGKNYNDGLGGPEDVWTRIAKHQLVDVSEEKVKDGITLSAESGFSMEVEYDNINSIKIAGDLVGKYQLVIKEESGMERKTRYSIPNLREFFEKVDDEKLKIISIKLEKIAETKDLEILLDDLQKSEQFASVSNSKKIKTTETRIQKEEVGGSTDVTEREVFMVSLFDVLDQMEATMEYVYKYDVNGVEPDELVGVKITRDIGKSKGSSINNKNTQTYQDIDKNIGNIVREVELKFNKMSIEDIFSNLEFTVNDEYAYTPESRGVIITDHSYLVDDEEVKVDNAVVSRYYKDVLEVPPMFVKEDYRSVLENGEQVSEGGELKKTSYMRQVRESEIEEDDGSLKSYLSNKEDESDKFLYVPACYRENDKEYTSYLFKQLGIEVSSNGSMLQFKK